MYAIKAFITFLVLFVTLATALPTPHRRLLRRTCMKGTSSGAAEPKATSTASATKAGASDIVSAKSTKSSSSTKTSTGTKAAGTGTVSSTSSNSLVAALFPVAATTSGSQGWTTIDGVSDALALSDATFRPTKILSALTHTYMKAPDGSEAMRAHYPKGSYNFENKPLGGFSFYAPGASDVDLTTAKEATFGYSVWFDKGFQWQKGGKLPGIYGGDSAAEATSCSGGSRSAHCFSARFMWRADGRGEFYTYLPPMTESQFSANKVLCNVAPLSDCNSVYGASSGRGAFVFESGTWNQISERVRLNDVGQANGELELYFNGKSVINISGLILRDSDAGRMRGLMMQTFFGGSSSDFATPATQDSYFKDFSVAITEKL